MMEPTTSVEEEHRNDGNCKPSESANSKRTAAAAAADTDSASRPWKGVKPGAKIAVYDPKTKHYYPCTVLREAEIETESDPCGLFEVQYEDSTEIADLARTPFRWQDCEEGEEEEGNDDDEDYAEEEEDNDDDDDVYDDDDDDESWDESDDDRKPAARRSSNRAAKRKRDTKRVIEIDETDDEDNGDEADEYKDASNASDATNQRRRATRRNSIRIEKHEVNPIIEIDSSDDEHNKGSETKSATRDDEDNEVAASHRVPVHDGRKDDAARERCEPACQDRSKGSEPGIEKNGAAGKDAEAHSGEDKKSEGKSVQCLAAEEADVKSKKRKKAPSNSDEKKEPATAANSDEEPVASVQTRCSSQAAEEADATNKKRKAVQRNSEAKKDPATAANSDEELVASVQTRCSSEAAEEADATNKKRKEAPTRSPKTELQSKSNSSGDGVVSTKNENDREQVAMSPQKKMKVKATSVGSIKAEPKSEPNTEPKTTPKSKDSSKPRAKRAPSKRMTEYRARKAKANQSSEKEAAKTNKPKRLTVKDVKASHDAKELTKEDALLSLLVAHSIAGIQGVTFERLFTELGYRPKNRAVEKAWKEVRQDGLVEEAPAPPEGRKTKGRLYRLTQKGIDRAAPEEYLQWVAEASALENAAASNAELHELIKANAVNDYGAVIFEIMLEANQEGVAKSAKEMADECGVDKDSHGFFYGFKWLKDQGYAVANPGGSKGRSKLFVLSDKCFV